PIPRDYESPRRNAASTPITSVMRDGVGVVAGGTYDADSSYVGRLFDSMYTDIKPVSSLTITEAPYVRELAWTTAIFFSARWLQTGTTQNPFSRHTNPNVYHRIAASQAVLIPDLQTGRSGAELGITGVSGNTNYTVILVQRIED